MSAGELVGAAVRAAPPRSRPVAAAAAARRAGTGTASRGAGRTLLLLLLVGAATLLAACGGGRQALCVPDPAYAGRRDGERLQIPADLDDPGDTGRFVIPPILESNRQADPRCTAYPPSIAGVETADPRSRRERRQAAEAESAAAGGASAAGADAASPLARAAQASQAPRTTGNAREPVPPPAPQGDPVATDSALYARAYDLVAAWSAAWDDKRFDDYLARYADSFAPPRPMDRAQWEDVRARRMEEGAQAVVALDTLVVYDTDRGTIVRFREDFAFEGIESVITKELWLVEEGGALRIAAERVVDVR